MPSAERWLSETTTTLVTAALDAVRASTPPPTEGEWLRLRYAGMEVVALVVLAGALLVVLAGAGLRGDGRAMVRATLGALATVPAMTFGLGLLHTGLLIGDELAAPAAARVATVATSVPQLLTAGSAGAAGPAGSPASTGGSPASSAAAAPGSSAGSPSSAAAGSAAPNSTTASGGPAVAANGGAAGTAGTGVTAVGSGSPVGAGSGGVLASTGGPAVVAVPKVVLAGAALMVLLQSLARDVALSAAALAAPVAFAAALWPVMRPLAARAAGLVAALVLAKFMMLTVLDVGLAYVEGIEGADSLRLHLLLTGVFVLAAVAPWLLVRGAPVVAGVVRSARAGGAGAAGSDDENGPLRLGSLGPVVPTPGHSPGITDLRVIRPGEWP